MLANRKESRENQLSHCGSQFWKDLHYIYIRVLFSFEHCTRVYIHRCGIFFLCERVKDDKYDENNADDWLCSKYSPD